MELLPRCTKGREIDWVLMQTMWHQRFTAQSTSPSPSLAGNLIYPKQTEHLQQFYQQLNNHVRVSENLGFSEQLHLMTSAATAAAAVASGSGQGQVHRDPATAAAAAAAAATAAAVVAAGFGKKKKQAKQKQAKLPFQASTPTPELPAPPALPLAAPPQQQQITSIFARLSQAATGLFSKEGGGCGKEAGHAAQGATEPGVLGPTTTTHQAAALGLRQPSLGQQQTWQAGPGQAGPSGLGQAGPSGLGQAGQGPRQVGQEPRPGYKKPAQAQGGPAPKRAKGDVSKRGAYLCAFCARYGMKYVWLAGHKLECEWRKAGREEPTGEGSSNFNAREYLRKNNVPPPPGFE